VLENYYRKEGVASMNWLEISLTVNGELAEAVADVFARFAPNGVTTEQAVEFTNDEDEGTPIGPITVRAYLPEDATLDETRRKLEEGLHFLGMIQPLPAPVFTPLVDRDWMEAWKERYQPIPVGKKLIIVPAWLENPAKDRLAIRIDPGMAFGTGTHPTTQLCLEFLEEQFYDRTIQRVIDVGCGSGILSIAALKLGADLALGVDVDPLSLRASRENSTSNGIEPTELILGEGSVKEILQGRFHLAHEPGGDAIRLAPLVLANILAPIIIRLFDQGLATLVKPGGALILSGILEEQQASVIAAGQAHGMILSGKKSIDDWVALLMHPQPLKENK
jgi:ribosomal protein L11 methyltransferase